MEGGREILEVRPDEIFVFCERVGERSGGVVELYRSRFRIFLAFCRTTSPHNAFIGEAGRFSGTKLQCYCAQNGRGGHVQHQDPGATTRMKESSCITVAAERPDGLLQLRRVSLWAPLSRIVSW